MIKKYNDFINESILGKVKELANFRTISKNDKIADKYIDMIYADWEKKKDVIKAFIRQNDGYDVMDYRITDNIDSYPGVSSHDGDIDIKLTYIKESGWDRDISNGRIEVTIFRPYKGDLVILGSKLNSDEIINDDNGVKESYSSYVNISGKRAKDVISFMKSNYIDKYPDLKSNKNLSHIPVFEIDKDLARSRRDRYDNKRRKQEEEYHRMRKEASDILNKNSKFDEGYFDDVFLESQEKFGFHMNVIKFLKIDKTVFYSKMYSKYEHVSSMLNNFDYELEDNKLYVLLGFDTSIKSIEDYEDYNQDEDYYESISNTNKVDSEIVNILKSKSILSQFELLSIEEVDVVEESIDFGKPIYGLSSKLGSGQNTIIALLKQK